MIANHPQNKTAQSNRERQEVGDVPRLPRHIAQGPRVNSGSRRCCVNKPLPNSWIHLRRFRTYPLDMPLASLLPAQRG